MGGGQDEPEGEGGGGHRTLAQGLITSELEGIYFISYKNSKYFQFSMIKKKLLVINPPSSTEHDRWTFYRKPNRNRSKNPIKKIYWKRVWFDDSGTFICLWTNILSYYRQIF